MTRIGKSSVYLFIELFSPPLLRECLGDVSEKMDQDIDFFNNLIPDRAKTEKEGQIKPKKGMDAEYDQSIEDVQDAEQQLLDFLAEQKKKFKSNSLSYTGTGKNRYQLEIPENLCEELDDEYELKSKKKGMSFNRRIILIHL